jgi:hypothetical protein
MGPMSGAGRARVASRPPRWQAGEEMTLKKDTECGALEPPQYVPTRSVLASSGVVTQAKEHVGCSFAWSAVLSSARPGGLLA